MPVNIPTAPVPSSSSSSNMSSSPTKGKIVSQETVPVDQPQHQFVREKIESTAATVGNVYDTVKNSFGLVSWTLSKAETVASYVVTPVTNVVVDNIGNPILNKVDNVVGTIHDKVFPGQAVQTTTVQVSNLSIVELAAREKIKLAVDNDWFRHVDEIISRGFDIKHSFTVFYHAGVESYRAVYDQTKDGVVSFDAFQARFEKTLHKAWDTRLAVAAKTFYNKVENNTKGICKKISHAQLFAGVKEELYQHEFYIVAAFRDQLGQPSAYVYNMSVEAFLQTGPNVSPNTFVNAVKKRLETSWSDALELPIAEFYEGAKTVPTDDLIRFTKTIGLRGWTIGDVVNLFEACNEMVSEEVTTKYQSLLRVGQNVVDFVIPDFNKQGQSQDELEAEAKKLSLTGVVASGPLRVADRVVTGVKLSSEAIAPLIHVDLVKFGESVVESTKNHASTSSAQLSEALNKLKLAMDDMKTVAIKSTKLDYVAEKVSNVTHAVTDPVTTRVDAVTTELDARLSSVASTAKDLSSYSQDYMLNTEIRRFPSDTLSFLSQATNLVIPVDQNQEFSESVVKVQHLLTAIKDVFIWSGNWKSTEAAAVPAQ